MTSPNKKKIIKNKVIIVKIKKISIFNFHLNYKSHDATFEKYQLNFN